MTELEQGLVRDSDREDSALAAAEPAQGPGVCSTHPGGAPIAATAHDSFGAPREKNSAVTGSSPLAPETRLPPHHLSKCSACGRDVGPASSRHQQQRPQRQTQSRSQGTARFLGATVSFALPAAPPQWWPWRGGRCREEHHLLSKLLEAKATHIVIIGLVLLDLAIVCTELILSSTYCDREATPHAVHVAEDWLRWASVAILCIFVAELLLRLLVYGLSYYSTSFFHLLDLAVVVTSLVLELALHGVAQEAVALLVFFRLWRILRIMHSVSEVLEMDHEEREETHHKLLAQAQQKLAAAQQHVAALEEEVVRLRRPTGAEAQAPAAAAVAQYGAKEL
ncbi:hypothetical protein N2152v2_002792 [Parachlorella kessleri]